MRRVPIGEINGNKRFAAQKSVFHTRNVRRVEIRQISPDKIRHFVEGPFKGLRLDLTRNLHSTHFIVVFAPWDRCIELAAFGAVRGPDGEASCAIDHPFAGATRCPVDDRDRISSGDAELIQLGARKNPPPIAQRRRRHCRMLQHRQPRRPKRLRQQPAATTPAPRRRPSRSRNARVNYPFPISPFQEAKSSPRPKIRVVARSEKLYAAIHDSPRHRRPANFAEHTEAGKVAKAAPNLIHKHPHVR